MNIDRLYEYLLVRLGFEFKHDQDSKTKYLIWKDRFYQQVDMNLSMKNVYYCLQHNFRLIDRYSAEKFVLKYVNYRKVNVLVEMFNCMHSILKNLPKELTSKEEVDLILTLNGVLV